MHVELLEKYNVPAPHYTSYPTVPYWDENRPAEEAWKRRVLNAFREDREISLYIHLPYCESLCTYCGCNKRITKGHEVESPYIDSVLKEWALYTALLPEKPILRELHLGGGTPTFFSPANLRRLISGILAAAEAPDECDFGFEAHPGSTTTEHLEALRQLGFRRLSIGVQDFDPEILKIVNRKQDFEDVHRATRQARRLGYTSINYDLIFGLPLQTKDHIREAIRKVRMLLPERVAFYSYAHVPWMGPGRRAYSEADLPRGKAKRELYELGRELLETAGYSEIGMGHFALPNDSLFRAREAGSLHRNFTGYTPYFTQLALALGVSGISDSWDAFVQNEKQIEAYQNTVGEGRLPIVKGHLLTEEDQVLRGHILNLLCRNETIWYLPEYQCDALYEGLERLDALEESGLVRRYPFQLKVTPKGRPFIRNICLALDARYWRKQPEGQLLSRVV